MTTYTVLHVVISLVGIGSGLVVLFGLLTGQRLDRWTVVFLASTVATSATGFGFPVDRVLPSHIVGAISLVVLAVAIFARYGRQHGRPVARCVRPPCSALLCTSMCSWGWCRRS